MGNASATDEVRDPNAWASKAIRNCSSSDEFTEKVSKQVWWLNNVGNVDNSTIDYERIAASAAGISTRRVLQVLSRVRARSDVKFPTDWLIQGLANVRAQTRGWSQGDRERVVKSLRYLNYMMRGASS